MYWHGGDRRLGQPGNDGKDGQRKEAINIGISNGAKTEVLKGLNEGDQVILQ